MAYDLHIYCCYVSQVLFLKNLHHKVTEDDLLAVFGCCVEQEEERLGGGQTWPRVRVMSGKMKGQAFIEFHSEFLWLPEVYM